ncbi:MAG TPA: VVA0879 family protein [Spongiibacteraceae bacterium]|nr:VVA0879 family protein [Spongiibacteraceae bacterium]
MKTMTIPEFHAALKAQGVADRSDLAMICPMCGTVQSARDLIAAGAGLDFDAVEKFLGFSCVGRFTGAGTPRKQPDGKPCNWTLGGLFQTHKLVVVDNEGVAHPRFELATPEQAQQHASENARKVGAEAPQ